LQPTRSRTDTTESQVLVQHLITKKWSTPCFITQVGTNREYVIRTTSGTT
ncbi:hypothetical protein T4D_1903, partial [Trichinella pseudospiralis]